MAMISFLRFIIPYSFFIRLTKVPPYVYVKIIITLGLHLISFVASDYEEWMQLSTDALDDDTYVAKFIK